MCKKMIHYSFIVVASLFCLLTTHQSASGFISTPAASIRRAPIITCSADDDRRCEATDTANDAELDRRDVLNQLLAVGLSTQIITPTLVQAATAGGIGSSADKPIVVIGAGGRVGKLCVETLASRGLHVCATTRSGRNVLDNDSKYVSYASADVTKYESVSNALKGASGCIFAASASGKKAGGEPPAVEFLGAYNTGKACLANNVAKLVLISSTAVTRPNSLGFKATNLSVKFSIGDRVMDAKIAGEAAIRDLYADSNGPAYCIVRPGGLQNREESAGSANVHVSQGDVYASEIGRIDVAETCVAALLKGKATDFTTLEVNLVEGLIKCQRGLPDLPKELIHAGAPSFDSLLDGLLTDVEMKERYPELLNPDFRGDGLPSLETLISQEAC